MITHEEFSKVEIRVGKILSAEKVVGSEKLLKLQVEFGVKNVPAPAEDSGAGAGMTTPTTPPRGLGTPPQAGGEGKDIRQIISGIAKHFPDPAALIGVRCAFVTNLEPRMIFGLESNGMILAVSTDTTLSLLRVSDDIPPGTLVR